jgi:hypothetical protein
LAENHTSNQIQGRLADGQKEPGIEFLNPTRTKKGGFEKIVAAV